MNGTKRMCATILTFLTVLFPLTLAVDSAPTGTNYLMRRTSSFGSEADTKAGKRTLSPTISPSSSKPGLVSSTSPTYSPSYIPTYLPTSTPTIAPISMSMPPSSGGKSGKSGGKAGKSSYPSSSWNLCEKRFDLAWEANVNADYVIATTKQEMAKRCEFDTTDTSSNPFAPNLSCPFIYTNKTGFLDNQTAVIAFFRTLTSDAVVGNTFWLFQMYCQCKQGYDLGCASKIPHGPSSTDIGYNYGNVHVSSYSEFIPASTPAERAEYCAFAGIWNGDFDLDNYYDLPKDVQDCGCFWVGEAQEMVDDCPGVDLGAFLIDPTNPTNFTNMANSAEHIGTSWRQNLTLMMAGKWKE
ncbi:hypothetical protein HJC23_013628 [Cyclotella cryptica]|uniref:Uncharacterized protein n=1 Tax=Cyclotella cryptica TaxID=29204 RepID=A0ABD3PDL6_9STRA|eukprot:CCRYP_016505-RB/>CCRYP_016505-RB protein AED:0.04 eAED:0.04 QI:859/1/1/1/0.5/0.66/3/127/352